MGHARTASDTYRNTDRSTRNASGAATQGPARAWDRWLLAAVHGGLNQAPIRLRLWDGTTLGPADAVATVRIHDRGALVALVRHPDLAFGDGYAAGRIDVEGRMVDLLEALFRAKPGPSPSWRR